MLHVTQLTAVTNNSIGQRGDIKLACHERCDENEVFAVTNHFV